MSKFYWKSNLEHKLRVSEIVILEHKMKTVNPAKTCVRKFYVHE